MARPRWDTRIPKVVHNGLRGATIARVGGRRQAVKVSLRKKIWAVDIYNREGSIVGQREVCAANRRAAYRKFDQFAAQDPRAWIGLRWRIPGYSEDP